MGYRYRRRRRGFLAALALFATLLILFVGYLFWSFQGYARLPVNAKFWFLMQPCKEDTAVAVSQEIYLSGGAGILTEEGGRPAVVLASYYSEGEAESVARFLASRGVETKVSPRSAADVELFGKNVRFKKQIGETIATVRTCARTLYEVANRLERAELSQEEGRAALKAAASSLRGLISSDRADVFARWNSELYACVKKAEGMDGLIFSRDVRYLQVKLCLCVVSAADLFKN